MPVPSVAPAATPLAGSASPFPFGQPGPAWSFGSQTAGKTPFVQADATGFESKEGAALFDPAVSQELPREQALQLESLRAQLSSTEALLAAPPVQDPAFIQSLRSARDVLCQKYAEVHAVAERIRKLRPKAVELYRSFIRADNLYAEAKALYEATAGQAQEFLTSAGASPVGPLPPGAMGTIWTEHWAALGLPPPSGSQIFHGPDPHTRSVYPLKASSQGA